MDYVNNNIKIIVYGRMRMKLKHIFIHTIVLIFIINISCFANSLDEYELERKIYNELNFNQKFNLSEDFILNILTNDIFEATEKIYGKVKMYDNQRILYIKPYSISWNNAGYEIEIEIETFTGAHNPPYFKDNLIFRVNGADDSKVEIINYTHKEI